MHLNWLAKIEGKEASGSLAADTVAIYCCKRKVLKEIEQTIGFFVTFLSLMTFQWERGGAPAPSPLGNACVIR